jgi:hypothetical protein
MKKIFQQDEKVTIFNIGDGKEHRAIVKGIAMDSVVKFYILEAVDKFRTDVYPYSHVMMIEGCIREGWKELQSVA